MSGHGENFNSKYYCKKHDLLYMEHLHRCPICWGEEMSPAYQEPLPYNTSERTAPAVERVPQRTTAVGEPAPKRIPERIPERVPQRVPQRVPRRVQ